MNEFASYNESNIPKSLLTYDGKTGKIFGIWIKNVLLSIVTLGIYRAWAKTNMRKYTFSSFSVDGSRLEYSGKGGELFKGFVVVAVFYFVLALAVDFAIEVFYPDASKVVEKIEKGESVLIDFSEGQTQEKKAISGHIKTSSNYISPDLITVVDPFDKTFSSEECLQRFDARKCDSLYREYIENKDFFIKPKNASDENSIEGFSEEIANTGFVLYAFKIFLFILASILLLFFATFSAFRYRLTRTRYKGIHGAVRGATAKGYVWLRLRRFFLNLLTLGFTVGRSDLIAQKYILQNSYIGKTQFNFEPNVKALDKVNFVTLLLAIPTLFISRFWYKAALLNEKYNNLSMGGVKMESSFAGGKLFWLRLSNMLLLVISLGFASAYILNRTLNFFNNHVSMRGNESALKLMQEQADSGTVGEGLDEGADFGGFDVDFGMI